ncbi:uncharacterized protein VTP21DRAFT_6705 [Calcarisporiella thermophila]|uniref:uncharacterized protein n=1 Tax=Calcarisporiella thermophila TaxID=911321 RepID=UPI0037444A99
MPDDRPLPAKTGSLPSKSIPQAKIQAFSIGTHKKSAFQRYKEEQEARKKKEEEDAAKVYEEFVASFEKDEEPKTFVRGNTIIPKVTFDHDEANATAPEGSRSIYRPEPVVKTMSAVPPPPSLYEDPTEKKEENDRPKKKRNLDMFLEEIKKEQEQREDRFRHKHSKFPPRHDPVDDSQSITSRAAFETATGSHYTGDPTTTNLYIGNLSAKVTEEILCREFSKHGPIASVKIMWPRSVEERDRQRNAGFVGFMDRRSAESALAEMDGKDLYGMVIRVGWGKAIALPPRPIYVHGEGFKTVTGYPFNAQLVQRKPAYSNAPPPGSYSHVPPPDASTTSSQSSHKDYNHSGPRLEVHVTKPADHRLLCIIHRMIERVLRYGPPFEALVMDRERRNPDFRFLFDNTSPEHVYYRWKMYSLLQGDSVDRWRTEPFLMFDEGPIWVPPELPAERRGYDDSRSNSPYSSDYSDSSEDAPKGALAPRAKRSLESMLQSLTLRRSDILEAMVFAIDHAEAAFEIVDVVASSLMEPEATIPTKLARLYLISDILHNCGVGVAGAWRLRQAFEAKLPTVFEHLNTIYRSISGRLKAEQFRLQVMAAVNSWSTSIVFAQPYIDDLVERLVKKSEAGEEAGEKES